MSSPENQNHVPAAAELPEPVQAIDVSSDVSDGLSWGMDEWEDASLLEDDRTPEQIAAAEKADICSQLYLGGVQLEEGEEFLGVTQKDMQDFLAGLEPEKKQRLDEQKADQESQKAQYEDITEALRQEVPELLEGRLPDDQAERVGSCYVLGSNQSGRIDAEEAQGYLAQQDGVDITGYGIGQRFLLFDERDPAYAEQSVVKGYYGVYGGGRFIVAFPVAPSAEAKLSRETAASFIAEAQYSDDLPEDIVVHHGETTAVNARYCAGFIDPSGKYHRNKNFMQAVAAPFISERSKQTGDDWL